MRTGLLGQLWANTGSAVSPTRHTLKEAMAFLNQAATDDRSFHGALHLEKTILGYIIQVPINWGQSNI
jgi:hypothetical protein